MSDLKSKITVSKVNEDFTQILYLSPKIESTEEDGVNKISLEKESLVVKLKSYSINAKHPLRLVEDLMKFHGISPDEMIFSVMKNEMVVKQEKEIYDSMCILGSTSSAEKWTPLQRNLNSWFGFLPKIKIPRSEEILPLLLSYSNMIYSRNRTRPGEFIIIGSGLYESIVRLNSFSFAESERAGIRRYEAIGTLGSRLQVILNRDLKHNDLSVVIGASVKKNEIGIHLLEGEDEFLSNETLGPELNPQMNLGLKKKFTVAITKNARFNYYTLQMSHKRYHLFRFFSEKLGGFFKNKKGSI